MLPGLPPEMLKMAKDMGIFDDTKEPVTIEKGRSRKQRNRKKLRKRKMVNVSKRKNR